MVNVTPTLKNLDHPLNKIFGGIPAGSSDLPNASVRHYRGVEYTPYAPLLLFFGRWIASCIASRAASATASIKVG